MDRPMIAPDPARGPACFAPPLDESALARYQELAETAPEPVRDAMLPLVEMVRKFRETPASTRPGISLRTDFTRNPFVKNGQPVPPPKIVPLEQAEVNRMWDMVPWPHEVEAVSKLFQTLPKGELRNAAYHLVWFAKELGLDREPMTNDKL